VYLYVGIWVYNPQKSKERRINGKKNQKIKRKERKNEKTY